MPDAPSTPTDSAATLAPATSSDAELAHESQSPAIPLAAAQLRVRRIPHFGHVALLGFLLLGGLVCSVILIFVALHFHLFGVGRPEDAMHSMPYAVGTMIVWYLFAFAPAAAIFPSLWGKGAIAGVHWNASIARRRWPILAATGIGCFLIALSAKSLLHFPDKSPITGLLTTPQAVWIMFAFAITIAPLCEEAIFRGFLLPAFSTAFDWTAEKLTHRSPRPLLETGHPQWSPAAMIFGAILTSALFASFHMGQIGNAFGPIVLIFCVSLVLCAVRLATRSLAASTLTHATYNFTLFFVMAITTHGFHHLHN
jgi:uncharacterized protein